jgi:hypothetical protein
MGDTYDRRNISCIRSGGGNELQILIQSQKLNSDKLLTEINRLNVKKDGGKQMMQLSRMKWEKYR